MSVKFMIFIPLQMPLCYSSRRRGYLWHCKLVPIVLSAIQWLYGEEKLIIEPWYESQDITVCWVLMTLKMTREMCTQEFPYGKVHDKIISALFMLWSRNSRMLVLILIWKSEVDQESSHLCRFWTHFRKINTWIRYASQTSVYPVPVAQSNWYVELTCTVHC